MSKVEEYRKMFEDYKQTMQNEMSLIQSLEEIRSDIMRENLVSFKGKYFVDRYKLDDSDAYKNVTNIFKICDISQNGEEGVLKCCVIFIFDEQEKKTSVKKKNVDFSVTSISVYLDKETLEMKSSLSSLKETTEEEWNKAKEEVINYLKNI